MPRTSLSPAERRARDRSVVLDRLGGAPVSEVAKRHGVSQVRVYEIVREAVREPQEELVYWTRVVEMLGESSSRTDGGR